MLSKELEKIANKINTNKTSKINAEEMIESYINGNISDFKKNAKRLKAAELLELAIIWQENYKLKLNKLLSLLT